MLDAGAAAPQDTPMPTDPGRRIGLIVNPVAGMGGAVALKGTDGAEILASARRRGAVPQSGGRARRALAALAAARPGAQVLAAPGPMGADAAGGLGLALAALDLPLPAATGAAETQAAARALVAAGVALILFAGGDGTARDVLAVAGLDAPMLGIPAGVKMQSGVFATSPEAAGRLAADLLAGDPRVGFRRVEIMDIDEAALRAGRLSARLYGYARAPHERNLLQGAKGSPPRADEADLDAACAEIAAGLDPGRLWLIGPGTTAKRVLAALGLDGTLLGVDAVRDGRLAGRDLTAAEAERLAGEGPVGIVVGVTGGQGFVFGRGNQQIGPEMIRRAGRTGLIVAASREKLASLPGGRLHLDTGDPALDAALAGHIRVRTGPRQSMLMRMTA
jgi:predicted polyphosphate/ATP-dependent NAD kinase